MGGPTPEVHRLEKRLLEGRDKHGPGPRTSLGVDFY